ncbi:putative FBD-associated F-box protein At5g56390 [Vicia villosa]|uniref:putative FBD-associated F-box protein At5g56390 n=1 Tax=Vicia villosa TaxID=3911 RepID=UPI00273AB355|nr:putative FBD-associated F-box protein At5g56390 [Vicia villosa]
MTGIQQIGKNGSLLFQFPWNGCLQSLPRLSLVYALIKLSNMFVLVHIKVDKTLLALLYMWAVNPHPHELSEIMSQENFGLERGKLLQSHLSSGIAASLDDITDGESSAHLRERATHFFITFSRILSKRWKQLWRSQLSLYFDDRYFPDTFAFRGFFNSFIIMRDNTLPILSFHLYCRHPPRFACNNHFYKFVYAAITRGVQHLIIDVCQPDDSRPTRSALPSLVLSTKALSVLKLKEITLYDVSCVDLPLLKVLHLESVKFTYYEYLQKLLSGCPILQELEAKDLSIWINTMISPTGIASISSLIRANIFSYLIEFDWLHNVEHLHIQLNRKPPTITGMFHNLTHLELIFNFDYPSFGILKWSWLIKLLQNSPHLRTLIIDEVNVVRRYNEWEDPEIVLECLLSHLTTCSLRNYSLMYCEFRFAKYIIQNSRVLSTMTIQSAKFLDTNTKLQMLMELSLCPRISATCKLLFI